MFRKWRGYRQQWDNTYVHFVLTSVVFKRYQAGAAKRALDSPNNQLDEHDNIARQLEASSKRRRKMDKKISAGRLLPPRNHHAARLRFPYLPTQGGRINERGTITPQTTFPNAFASSRSNPYVFCHLSKPRRPTMGEHQWPRAKEAMAIAVRPKEVGGVYPILQLLDVVVFSQLPQSGNLEITLWSQFFESVFPVKESAKIIMRITGRIDARDALMVYLV